jgi:hypothetical protein
VGTTSTAAAMPRSKGERNRTQEREHDFMRPPFTDQYGLFFSLGFFVKPVNERLTRHRLHRFRQVVFNRQILDWGPGLADLIETGRHTRPSGECIGSPRLPDLLNSG